MWLAYEHTNGHKDGRTNKEICRADALLTKIHSTRRRRRKKLVLPSNVLLLLLLLFLEEKSLALFFPCLN